MIKCDLCWCHRITNSWKGLGCKLRSKPFEETHKKLMPCNFHENLMYILMLKHHDAKKIADVRKELANGFEVDVNDIGKISVEIDDILKQAEDKIKLLINNVQDRIVEMEEEYRKSVAEKSALRAADELSHGCASTQEEEE